MRRSPAHLVALSLAAAASLACSGLMTKPVTPHTFRPFAISLIEGSVDTENDAGTTGSVTINAVGLVQSATWTQAGTVTGETLLQNAWTGGRQAMLAELKGNGDIPEEMPPLTPSIVDGQRALTWEWEGAGLNYLTATTFECPGAGVQALLATGGLPFGAKETHSRSLASVVCATEPVTLTEADRAYRFVGPTDVWSELPADTPGMQMWAVADRTSVVVLQTSASFLGKPADSAATCRTVASQAKTGLGADYTVDPATVRTMDTADGCAEELVAASAAQGSNATFRTVIRQCSTKQTIVASCISFNPAFAITTCDSLFVCAEGGAR